MPQSGNVTQNIPEDWEDQGAAIPEGERKWDPQERPPADWFNYFFYHVIEALKDLDINAEELANGTTADSILSKLKTVDGSGSGLNADTLDGKHASTFAYSEDSPGVDVGTITQSGIYRLGDLSSGMPPGVEYGQLLVMHGGGDTIAQIITDYYSKNMYWRSGNPPVVGGQGSWGIWEKIWHGGNDGHGSGLDADTLDGRHYSDIRVPAGTVIWHATSAPDGYLECNGAALSRTTYLDLFNVLGTHYGVGDGSTTFNIPDLRGEFIRGVDGGRELGSSQLDAIQNFTGWLTTSDYASASGVFYDTGEKESGESHLGGSLDRKIGFDPSRVARTSDETRPRNVALLPCIKY